MQLWLAVKNVLPFHTLPLQSGGRLNRSTIPFANDVLLVTSSNSAFERIPILAIPVYDIVLDGEFSAILDQHTSTSVPVQNIVTHSNCVGYSHAVITIPVLLPLMSFSETVIKGQSARAMPVPFRPRVFAVIVPVESPQTMPTPASAP